MKNILQNKKAMIFDLDGTLANTLVEIAKAVNMTMEHFGYPTHDLQTVQKAVGNGATTLIRRLLPKNLATNDEVVMIVRKKYDEMYAQTYMETDKMYDGVKEAVYSLKKKGIQISVFSNKQDEYVKNLSKLYFPDDTVSVARGQTDLPIKPNIAGLVKIMEEMNVNSEECIFVGDSGVDVETAKNANMDFIGVSWGFVGREALEACGAKIIIDDPCEFLEIVK